MPDEGSVSRTFNEIRKWNEFGARLNAILQEIKDKIGDAPLYVDEDGEVFAHPDLIQKLNEPGNEGPLEFLRYMQRTGITREQD